MNMSTNDNELATEWRGYTVFQSLGETNFSHRQRSVMVKGELRKNLQSGNCGIPHDKLWMFVQVGSGRVGGILGWEPC